MLISFSLQLNILIFLGFVLKWIYSPTGERTAFDQNIYPWFFFADNKYIKKKCEPRTCENRRGTLNQPAYPGYGKVLYCNKTITIHFRWGFSMYSTYSSFLNCNSNIYKSNKSTTLNVLNFPLSTTPKSALVDVSPQTSLWKILCERTCFRQLSSSHSCLDKSVFIGWEINSAYHLIYQVKVVCCRPSEIGVFDL